LLLFSIVVGSIALSELFYSEVNNELINYVPENAVYSCRIDSKSMIRETLNNLLTSDDQESIDLLQELMKSEDSTRELPGISFLDEIVIFSFPIHDNLYNGLLFNLSNKKKFEKFSRKISERGAGVAVKDNLALILFNNQLHELNQDQLNVQASTILNKNPNSSKTKSTKSSEIEVHLKNGIQEINSILMPGEVFMDFERNEIQLSGNMDIKRIPEHDRHVSIKGDDLLINIPTFTPIVRDSLQNLLEEFNLAYFQLAGLSVNYKGLTIEEVPGLKLQPEFEALLYFADMTSVDSLLQAIQPLNSEFIIRERQLSYGKMNYFFHQVNTQTIYIGTTKFNQNLITNLNPNVIMHVKGNPKNMTALKGEGMMRKLVELLSLYSASKSFTESMESIDYEINRINEETASVKGKLVFADETSAHLALLHFLLQSKLIR